MNIRLYDRIITSTAKYYMYKHKTSIFKGKSTKFNEYLLQVSFRKWNNSRVAKDQVNLSKDLQKAFEDYAFRVMSGLSTLCETYVTALTVLVSNLGFIFNGNDTLVHYLIDNNEDLLMQAYSEKAVIIAVRKKCKRRLDNGEKAVITYPKVTHVSNEKDRSANGDSFLAEEGYFYNYLLDNGYINKSTNKLTETKYKIFNAIKKSADTLECGIPVCSLSKAKFKKILELHKVEPFRTPTVIVDKYADCRVGLNELEELEQRIKEEKQHKQKEIIPMKKEEVTSKKHIPSYDLEVVYDDEDQRMIPKDVAIVRHHLVNEGYVHPHLLNLKMTKTALVKELRKSKAVVNGIDMSSINMSKLEEVMIRSNIGVYNKYDEELYESHKDLFPDDSSFDKREGNTIVSCYIDYKFDRYNYTVKDLEGYYQNVVNKSLDEAKKTYWKYRDKIRNMEGDDPSIEAVRREIDAFYSEKYNDDGYDVISNSERFAEGYYNNYDVKNDPDYFNNHFIDTYTNKLNDLGTMVSFNSYYWECINESKSNKNLAVNLEFLSDFYDYAFDRASQYILTIQRNMLETLGRRLNGIEMAYINAEIDYTMEHIAFQFFYKDNEDYVIKKNDYGIIVCDYIYHNIGSKNARMYQNKETNAHICLDCIIKNSLLRAFPFDTLLNASKRHHTDYSEFYRLNNYNVLRGPATRQQYKNFKKSLKLK